MLISFLHLTQEPLHLRRQQWLTLAVLLKGDEQVLY